MSDVNMSHPNHELIEMQPSNDPYADIDWMPKPLVGSTSPPGLEHLRQVDTLLVKETRDIYEALLHVPSIDTRNMFAMTNPAGERVYQGYEVSDYCTRIFCNELRKFQAHVVDEQGQELIRVIRPCQCCAGCCWFVCCRNFCSWRIRIECPPETTIGYVYQTWSIIRPQFVLQDEDHNDLYRLWGPNCSCQWLLGCTGSKEFRFTNSEGEEVARYAKARTGIPDGEKVRKPDSFRIKFHTDLDVKHKALIIGALFFLDVLYFEAEEA